MEKLTLTVALKRFIGMLPGQSLADFAVEIRALTPEDRAWFAREFAAVGVEIVEKAA